MKLLLVEDNPLTAKGLQYLLEREKYDIDVASSLMEAEALLAMHHYDLALLDVGLPDGDGFDLAESLHAYPDTAIIFLTAKDDEADVVKGLELGAEDYITKPFRNRELLLRIQKSLRPRNHAATQITIGNLVYEPANGNATLACKPLVLSAVERRLLNCLVTNLNQVVTRQRLLDEIYDASGSIVNDNTLSVYLKRLRQKTWLIRANRNYQKLRLSPIWRNQVMWQRLRKNVLPVILIGLVVGVVAVVALCEVRQQYRQSVNKEVSALVGIAAMGGDASEIISALRQPSTEQISRGAEILRQYGYFASDFYSSSALGFFWLALVLILIMLAVFSCSVIAYFWWRDWRRSRQIASLVDYVQDLSRKVYDLRLEENSEDELSILSNELYKITVLLREAADNNQKIRQQLETALADISHQLRTPLTSMQVMVDNIYDDPKMPVEVRQDFLRSISRQVESMSNLVMTLLNLAKFDNGSIRLQQLLEAGELLHEVRQKLEVLADLQDVAIEITGQIQAKTRLDRRWQVEALTNIVKNCLEHSPAGSVVTVNVVSTPLFLRFQIRDHGEGISKQDLRHIFERFYKAKNSAAGSVGIGLAFAKTVIEADNGQIAVKSEEGKGTEFTVTYFK